MSCSKTVTRDDVRKIKIGMSGNELKYIMGEPWDIEINNGYEEWRFTYDRGMNSATTLRVTMVNDKLNDSMSY